MTSLVPDAWVLTTDVQGISLITAAAYGCGPSNWTPPKSFQYVLLYIEMVLSLWTRFHWLTM